MGKIDLRDASGGYGTDMHDVRMDVRGNTPFGDREKDDVVTVSAFDAEMLVNGGLGHLVADEPTGRAAGAAKARAAKAAKRGDHADAEHRMMTGGDHTRSVSRS